MKKRILAILIGAMLILSGCGAAKENSEAVANAEVSQSAEMEGEAEEAESTDTESIAEIDGKEDAESAVNTSENENVGKTAEDAKLAEVGNSAAGKEKADNNSNKKESVDTEAQTKKSDSSTAEDQSKETESSKSEATEPAKTEAPAKVDYGRILFVGDSRSVDMFSGDQSRIYGEIHDGITVYAEDARDYTFLIEVMSSVGTENFDTLVSWMGANDYGNFANYQPHYEGLLKEGKRLILCTVGPTWDEALANDFDRSHYTNDLQIAFNNSLVAWANANGVKVIDLYSYLAGNTDITLDPADGIHYQPRPTGAIWGRIVSGMY